MWKSYDVDDLMIKKTNKTFQILLQLAEKLSLVGLSVPIDDHYIFLMI